MISKRLRITRAALALAIGAAHFSSAAAAPVAGGSAYDISLHLSVVGLAQFDITPFDTITVTDQAAAWSDSKQSVSADAGNAQVHLHTGDLGVAG